MNVMTDVWTTFERDQGQIVTKSYRYLIRSNEIVCRKHDGSEDSTEYSKALAPEGSEWTGAESETPWEESDLEWVKCDGDLDFGDLGLV